MDRNSNDSDDGGGEPLGIVVKGGEDDRSDVVSFDEELGLNIGFSEEEEDNDVTAFDNNELGIDIRDEDKEEEDEEADNEEEEEEEAADDDDDDDDDEEEEEANDDDDEEEEEEEEEESEDESNLSLPPSSPAAPPDKSLVRPFDKSVGELLEMNLDEEEVKSDEDASRAPGSPSAKAAALLLGGQSLTCSGKNPLLMKLKEAAKKEIFAQRLMSSSNLSYEDVDEEGLSEEAERGSPFHNSISSSAYLNSCVVVDGKIPRIIVGTSDNSIHVNHIYSGKSLPALIGHNDRVMCLAISSLDPQYRSEGSKFKRLIISGCRAGNICVWDFESLKCIHNKKAHKYPVFSVCILSRLDGTVMGFSGSMDGVIRIWDCVAGAKIGSFRGHTDKIFTMCFAYEHGKNPQLISGGADKIVKVWDINSAKHIRDIEGHHDDITALTAGSYPSLRSLSAIDPSERSKDSYKVAFMVLISGSADTSIMVWDLSNGHLLYELTGHDKCVQALSTCLSTLGNNKIRMNSPILVSCSEDKTIKLWDLENRRLVKTLTWHTGPVRQVVTCRMKRANGGHSNLLVSVGWDKTVRMHDFEEALFKLKTKNGGSTLMPSCSTS